MEDYKVKIVLEYPVQANNPAEAEKKAYDELNHELLKEPLETFAVKSTAIEGEPEFSTAQLERLDEVYNAVHELCKLMTCNQTLDCRMEYVGEIAEEAAEVLMRKGLPVYFPYKDEYGKIHDWYKNGEGVIER